MSNRFLVTVATLALVTGTGFGSAQAAGMNHEQSGAGVQQSSPGSERGSAMSNHQSMKPGMKSAESGQKKKSTVGQAPSEEKASGHKTGMSSENQTTNKEMKAPGREGRASVPGAESRKQAEGEKSQTTGENQGEKAQTTGRNEMQKSPTTSKSERSQTTGQVGAAGKGGAAASLSTEQRTKITSAFKEEHVAPVKNVHFSISVGTRIPRERITLHPLPSRIVKIYPRWHGYEFIRVRDEIVVVNPRTYEIVAVLPA